MAKKRTFVKTKSEIATTPVVLLSEVRQLILDARQQTYQAVNAALTFTNWRVGDRIRREILQQKRAEYGEQIVAALSRQLEMEFGRGYSEKSLRHMIRFVEAFPDLEIVSALSRQLAWSHFIALIPLKHSFHREIYAEMCGVACWRSQSL